MQDWGGWGGGPPGDLLVGFELGWLHGVLLCLHYLDDPLLRARVEGSGLLRGGVSHVLCWLQLVHGSDWQGRHDFALCQLLQSKPGLLGSLGKDDC